MPNLFLQNQSERELVITPITKLKKIAPNLTLCLPKKRKNERKEREIKKKKEKKRKEEKTRGERKANQ